MGYDTDSFGLRHHAAILGAAAVVGFLAAYAVYFFCVFADAAPSLREAVEG